jgi:hypothetical protein
MEYSYLKMEIYMRVNLKMVIFMGKESIVGRMAQFM